MHNTNLVLESIDGVSREVHDRVVESLKKREMETSRHGSVFCTKLSLLQTEFRERLRAEIGPASFDALNQIRRQHNEKMSAIINDIGLGWCSRRQREEIRRETRKASDTLIAAHKLDTNTVSILRKQYSRKARALVGKYFKQDDSSDNEPTIKNTNYYPPFHGAFSTGFAEITSAPAHRRPTNISYYNGFTGEIGGDLSSTLYDASDSDWSIAFRDSCIMHWHLMGGSGQVRVQAEIQNVDTRNWGTITDEWGWSDVYLIERCRPYVKLLYPTESPNVYGRAMYPSIFEGGGFDYLDTDNEDHSWGSVRYPAGNLLYFNTTIPGIVPSNSWVLVVLGVQVVDYFWTNDTSVDSNIRSRLRVRRLGITNA